MLLGARHSGLRELLTDQRQAETPSEKGRAVMKTRWFPRAEPVMQLVVSAGQEQQWARGREPELELEWES